MADLFPQKLLEESYMSVYSLEDVSKLLRKQAEPQAITKALNTHFSLYKMANLRLLNESYEENKQKIDNFRIKCQ